MGPEPVARLAYLRVTDSNANGTFEQLEGFANDTSQVMFSRRKADGTWTAPLAISALDADFKENPQLVVVNAGANSGVSFIFWREVSGGVADVHMARVSGADPPVILTPDSVISDAPAPAGTAGGSAIGSVTAGTLTATRDTVDGSVYAAWAQLFSTGTPDECVVAARYNLGGAGGAGAEPDEKIAMLVNNLDGVSADVQELANPPILLVFNPLPAVGGSGSLHVVWVSTNEAGATMAVRSRTRTGAATYTPVSPGDVVSDTLTANYRFLSGTTEPDGDIYVAWAQGPVLPTTACHHARRPAAGPFAASAVVVAPAGAPTGFGDVEIVLDTSTPVVAYKRQDAPGGTVLAGAAIGSPNASGPFSPEAAFRSLTVVAGEGPGTVRMFRESTNRIAIVYDAAPAAGGVFDLFGVVKAAAGAFGP